MPIKLVDALAEMLDGWHQDLQPAWQPIFESLDLGFDSIDPDLELLSHEPIFPARKNAKQLGAPDGAHLFRAFDELAPSDVRCILLGQDPYPCMTFSTGRAFDIGSYRSWRDLDNMFTHSMRSLMQCVCAERAKRPDLATDTGQWPVVLQMIENGDISLGDPPQLAQTWVNQGVLLLNASLTISRFDVSGDPHQTRGHALLWRPFMVRLLQRLLHDRDDPPPVVLFGDAAKATFKASFPERSAMIRDCVFETEHPAAGDRFLAKGNPFSICNELLAGQQADSIKW